MLLGFNYLLILVWIFWETDLYCMGFGVFLLFIICCLLDVGWGLCCAVFMLIVDFAGWWAICITLDFLSVGVWDFVI